MLIENRCANCGRDVLSLIHEINRANGQPPAPRSVAFRGKLCRRCDRYLKKHGQNCPFKSDGRKERFADRHSAICIDCKRPANVVGPPVLNRCRSCYKTLCKKRKRHREKYGEVKEFCLTLPFQN